MFQPTANQLITIAGIPYRFTEHPAATGIPYGQEGRQGIVYQLQTGGQLYALKVFRSRFQVPDLVELVARLRPFAQVKGLAVCWRTVLTAATHPALIGQYPGLQYAMLMPWVAFVPWSDWILDRRALTVSESFCLARSLARVLAGLHHAAVAHCDISGPNILLPPPNRIAADGRTPAAELVDVEQLWAPSLSMPGARPAGSPGYAHRTAGQGLWSRDADRFAAAVLLAEILAWCDARARDAAEEESYFSPDEMQQPGDRFDLLRMVLRDRWGDGPARLLERAWESDTLPDCPSLVEWLQVLQQPGLLAHAAHAVPALEDRDRIRLATIHRETATFDDAFRQFAAAVAADTDPAILATYSADLAESGVLTTEQQERAGLARRRQARVAQLRRALAKGDIPQVARLFEPALASLLPPAERQRCEQAQRQVAAWEHLRAVLRTDNEAAIVEAATAVGPDAAALLVPHERTRLVAAYRRVAACAALEQALETNNPLTIADTYQAWIASGGALPEGPAWERICAACDLAAALRQFQAALAANDDAAIWAAWRPTLFADTGLLTQADYDRVRLAQLQVGQQRRTSAGNWRSQPADL